MQLNQRFSELTVLSILGYKDEVDSCVRDVIIGKIFTYWTMTHMEILV
jgi:hypothetical protein